MDEEFNKRIKEVIEDEKKKDKNEIALLKEKLCYLGKTEKSKLKLANFFIVEDYKKKESPASMYNEYKNAVNTLIALGCKVT